MIPIFSILSFFLSLLTSFFFLKLYFSYRKLKIEAIKIFSKFFLFLTFFWLSLATPKLILNDLKLIQISLDTSLFFGCLAMAYFFLLPFKIYYQRPPPKFLFQGFLALGIIFLIFSILNLKPAFIHFRNNFVFWSENRSRLVNIVFGILFSFTAIVGTLLFSRIVLEVKEKTLKVRAFLISMATIWTILAAGVRFIFYFLFDIFLSTSIAFFSQIISTFFMILAVFFVRPEKKLFLKKNQKEE